MPPDKQFLNAECVGTPALRTRFLRSYVSAAFRFERKRLSVGTVYQGAYSI